MANLAQGTVCKILDQEAVKPHKVRYYLEQRDPDFAEKMAEVLCVYRQVKILKQGAAAAKKKRPSDAAMEDVLAVYTRPRDPDRRLVCLDETSKQLIAETRMPIPMKRGRPARPRQWHRREFIL